MKKHYRFTVDLPIKEKGVVIGMNRQFLDVIAISETNGKEILIEMFPGVVIHGLHATYTLNKDWG